MKHKGGRMKLKNILFIGNYPNMIDQYRNVFFRNLIYSIADRGCNCTVIMPLSITHYGKKAFRVPYEVDDITPKGNHVRVFFPKCITYSAKKIGTWNTGRLSEHSFQKAAVRAALKIKDKFDCVYGHFFLEGGLAATAVGRKLSIPSFIAYGECSYETEVEYSYGEIKEYELKSLKGIITVSTDNSNELKRQKIFDNFPKLLAPNGIDPKLFHKMDKIECRKKLKIPEDLFVVGFVGGFIERKGTARLLEAVNRVDGAYAAFAGKGEEKPEGQRVVFCDAMEHDSIPVLLNAADVFVLPTLAEGCCNAVIEAMACGLPVISSDLPFNHDILNEKNSILINPMNINEIRDAIDRIKKDQGLRKRLSQEALKTAEQLTIEARTDNILEFIKINIF